MRNDTPVALARNLGEKMKARRLRLVTAESCTGGGIAAAITAIAGSSDWFERGFVTYSNESKQELLGVREATLQRHGAVSEETAAEMVSGALARSRAQLAVAVTGIAGPSGGSADKPVGMVCFAWMRQGSRPCTETRRFSGGRASVRRQSVVFALRSLLDSLPD